MKFGVYPPKLSKVTFIEVWQQQQHYSKNTDSKMMLLYWESFANTLESFHWGFLSITPSPFSLKMTAIPTPYDYESHKMKLNGITRVIISGFPFQPWDSSMSHCISSLSILCIFPRMNTFIYHMLLKESACKSRCERHEIAGSERSGEGNGNLLQYFCLGNLMDRGAWWTRVHGVVKEPNTT